MQQSPDMTKAFWALRFCRALPPAHLIERCDVLLAVGGGGGALGTAALSMEGWNGTDTGNLPRPPPPAHPPKY